MNKISTIVAPFPPSVNTVYSVFRGRKILSVKGRAYKKTIDELLGSDREPITGNVEASYTFYRGDNRKYDISNYVKTIEDCLTIANYWEDDNQLVKITILKGEKDKENPRVEIIIKEVK